MLPMLVAFAIVPTQAAAALPDLCHAKPSLHIAAGSGSGNATADSSGCAALHFTGRKRYTGLRGLT
jgi:hypothetical protein